MTTADAGGKPESGPRPAWSWPLQEHETYIVDGKSAEHWMLDLIGSFASVQTGIDTVLSFHLRRLTPALAHKITKAHLEHLKDGDRWEYLKALSKDAGYSGNLVNSASDTYWQCKHVRDLVSHHESQLLLARDPDDPTYYYRIPAKRRKPQMPTRLTPEDIRMLGTKARWLDAFIDHIGYLAGITYASPLVRVGADGEQQLTPLQILEPPPLPIPADWTNDGLLREIPLTSVE